MYVVCMEMFAYELSQLVLQSDDELWVGGEVWRSCMVRQLHKINKNGYIHIHSIYIFVSAKMYVCILMFLKKCETQLLLLSAAA